MDSALTIAATGLHAAERAFTKAASDTLAAALPAPPPSSTAPATVISQPIDMASGIVAQMEANVAFRASLAVYRTASSMYRALLSVTDPAP